MSWKTSVCGVLAMVGGLLPQFWPQYAKLGAFLAALSTGLMGMVARDNNKTSEQVGAGQGSSGGLKLCFIFALGLVLLTTSCGTLQPGADPLEVRAEQSISMTADSIDELMTIEKQNQALVMKYAAPVHTYAEWLREPVPDPVTLTNRVPRGLSFIISANKVRRAYKYGRTAENKADLTTALETLQETLAQVQKNLNATISLTNQAFSPITAAKVN